MAFTISKEIRIGLLGVTSLVMLYFGVRFLRGTDFMKRENKFLVIYDEVGGLVEGNPVMVNGLTVGKVDDLRLDPQTQTKILVTLDVNKDIPVGDGTVAQLAASGLLGGKQINLLLGANKKVYEGGETLPSETETDMMANVQSQIKPLLGKADSLEAALMALISDLRITAKQVNKTLATVDETTVQVNGMLKSNDANIQRISGNTADLTQSLKDTEIKVKSLIIKLNTTADSLNKAQLPKTIKTAEKTLASLNTTLTAINQGQGTMGKLAKNDSLYRNLNASSEALTKLLNDFRERPKRYVHFSVFGRKESKDNKPSK